jgi:hypothetical protein
MESIRHIVLVGHCGADAYALTHLVAQALPGALVETAVGEQDLETLARPECLWLVNRQLDGRYDSPSGVELIRRAAARPNPPVLMLISNYPEAQDQAKQAGARRGFGKAAMHDPRTVELLRQVAGNPAAGPA